MVVVKKEEPSTEDAKFQARTSRLRPKRASASELQGAASDRTSEIFPASRSSLSVSAPSRSQPQPQRSFDACVDIRKGQGSNGTLQCEPYVRAQTPSPKR